MLSTVTWVATSGGDWDNGSNWSTGIVATSGQNVVIEPSSAQTITHIQNRADSVLSLTTNSAATLNLTAGTLNIGDGSSTFGDPTTVGSAATTNVAAGASVAIAAKEVLADNGMVTFAWNDAVTLGRRWP